MPSSEVLQVEAIKYILNLRGPMIQLQKMLSQKKMLIEEVIAFKQHETALRRKIINYLGHSSLL